jgi:hypothetical protein
LDEQERHREGRCSIEYGFVYENHLVFMMKASEQGGDAYDQSCPHIEQNDCCNSEIVRLPLTLRLNHGGREDEEFKNMYIDIHTAKFEIGWASPRGRRNGIGLSKTRFFSGISLKHMVIGPA